MRSRAASRSFQVFAKPVGAVCNLGCRYCYYLEKESLSAERDSLRMLDDLLEDYIVQHIAASPDEIIRFSWHGGEPTLAGLDYFRRIADLQRKHKPARRKIANGMQTNGTLLDEKWGRFLAAERFSVGLSLDGPARFHDLHRLAKGGRTTFEDALRGYEILKRHRVSTDILCVVHAGNVGAPLDVYRFFKSLGASFMTFLPLVERRPDVERGVSPDSVPAEAWGDFLCAVFDEWIARDIGRVKVQIFEEALRTAFGQEHSLCIFRPVCGDIPVLERNGDVFSCDHYVDAAHHLGNIRERPLVDLLESPAQINFGRAKAETLPRVCRECDVLAMCRGECPRNRFYLSPDGEPGLNYLCPGYKKFFRHCRPFAEDVASVWRRQAAGR
ncbi:MAG: anaerobic sulfatase maturase [Candidatus Aminicenantes bacterium]|nr:anaerobic sulfatase maturase [Candidatus Aminicenantes bacterium]